MRQITIDLKDILDLVCSAEEEGLLHMLPDFGRMAGVVLDEDITEYVKKHVVAGEDPEHLAKTLIKWRDQYAAPATISE